MLDHHTPPRADAPREHPLIAQVRDWLVAEADTIAACALRVGGTAWADGAERLCDAARAGRPLPRRELRALRDALVLMPSPEPGHLRAALHRPLPETDPLAARCGDVVRSLAWGLAVLGACGGTRPKNADAIQPPDRQGGGGNENAPDAAHPLPRAEGGAA